MTDKNTWDSIKEKLHHLQLSLGMKFESGLVDANLLETKLTGA